MKNEAQLAKKTKLKVIEGGLEPEEGVVFLPKLGEKEPDDWLSTLKQETVFLTKRRHSAQFMLEEWRLVNNNNKSFLLEVQLSFFTPTGHVWVIPRDFSKTYELVEVLAEGK